VSRRSPQTHESRALEAFLEIATRGQYLPTARWLRDMIWGLLVAGSPVLSTIAEKLQGHTGSPRRLIHDIKRLSRHLNSDRLKDDLLEEVALLLSSAHLVRDDGRGVVVACDHGDIAKPFARPDAPSGRGMQFATRHHDGSSKDGATVMGYELVQIEATLPDGSRVPLASSPFTTATPGYLGRIHEMVSAIRKVAPRVGPAAWWVFDRGFDSKAFFASLDDQGLANWIVRLKIGKGDPDVKETRHVIDSTGNIVGIYGFVHAIAQRHTARVTKPGRRPMEFACGMRSCWIQDGDHDGKRVGAERTVVTFRTRGREPVTLLVSRRISAAEIEQVVVAYLRRWPVEEAARRMKESRGWGLRMEDLRVLKYRGIQRLLLLGRLVSVFVAQIATKDPELLRVAVAIREGTPVDILYRLFRSVSRALERVGPPPRWATHGSRR